MDVSKEVARALVEIGAVRFVPGNPITFKSGIVSPVYTDNRILPFHPEAWKTVLQGFAHIIQEKQLKCDVVAGVEAAGIPHSSALGYVLGKPSVFVRKQAKDHGTKKLVEGGDVAGKKVILVEDLVTTGGSSLSAVQALRSEGAIVESCLVIVSYEFPKSVQAFKEASVNLCSLTSFSEILEIAIALGKCKMEEANKIKLWLIENKSIYI